MRDNKGSRVPHGRAAFRTGLVASLLILVAACMAVPTIAYASEAEEVLRVQTDGVALVDEYPEFADAILSNYVTRSSEPIDIPAGLDFFDVGAIVKSVLKAHPELCDVSTSYSTANQQFVPEYLFPDKSYDEIMDMRQRMAQGIAHAMSWIPQDGSDLEKVKAAHDWLVSHVVYHKATEQSTEKDSWIWKTGYYGGVLANHDPFYPYYAYGPLVEHSGVCEGISYAFMLLMDQCGIPCENVQNPLANHGWNHVFVGGRWYNLDATWDLDDSNYEGVYYNKIFSGYADYWAYWEPYSIKYDYFLKSDAAIIEVDNSRSETAHIGYDPYGNYAYCAATDTTYDGLDDSYWESQPPAPDAKYYQHAKTEPESFDLSSSSVLLEVGETSRLAVQNVAPAAINPLTARWASSDPSVAYVCADGTVVAVGEGTATITCTMGDAGVACLSDRTNEVIQTCEVSVGGDQPVDEPVDEPTEAPAFKSVQLLLGEQIKIEFWIEVPAGVDAEGAYAVFSIGGRNARTTGPIAIADAEYDAARNRYGFMFELSSIEMAEPITCTFTYGGDKTVETTMSVRDYIDSALAYGLKPVEVACIKAIANYGHYMQPYLAAANGWAYNKDYQTMDLCFADDNDVEAAKAAVQAYLPKKAGEGAQEVLVSCALSLDSFTTFDLFFEPAGGAAFSASATFGGQTYEATKVGNRYRIRVDRIKAGQLGDTVSVTGTAGGKDFQVSMQPLSFAYVVLNGSTYPTEAKEAVTSLYYYYSTAIALKASQQ